MGDIVITEEEAWGTAFAEEDDEKEVAAAAAKDEVLDNVVVVVAAAPGLTPVDEAWGIDEAEVASLLAEEEEKDDWRREGVEAREGALTTD